MEKAVKSKKAMEKASPEALRLAQQQETKKPGRERASLCPDQSQVGEDAHEDVETDVSHRRVHRIDHIKKARRSSFKKKLLPNKKSLLLEMDVSESSICESVNPVPSSKVQTPTTPSYEEVYRRENKKQIYDKKQMEKAAEKTVQAESKKQMEKAAKMTVQAESKKAMEKAAEMEGRKNKHAGDEKVTEDAVVDEMGKGKRKKIGKKKFLC